MEKQIRFDITPEGVKAGDRGNVVKLLQRLCNTVVRGLAPELVIDGIFGAKTEHYVRICQGYYSLEETGIATGQLFEKLLGFEF